jgi:ECF transporter S component (folate family)
MNGINNTKRIVGTAMFVALSYVASMLEFPIFPAAPFLKLDFSAVFIALAGFIFGPLWGVIACFCKELIAYLTKSSTGGVGEIANFVVVTGFILIPSIVYCYKKGFLTVVITMAVGCVVQVGLALLANRFVNFPFFFGEGAVAMFGDLWVYILAFNAIKSVSISIVTIILYKRISGFIKRI